MKLSLFLVCFVIPLAIAKHNYEGSQIEDNEFAEFEDFDGKTLSNYKVPCCCFFRLCNLVG